MKEVHADIGLHEQENYLFIVRLAGLLDKHLVDVSKFYHFDGLLQI
jgi:hypothetical protein